MRLRIECDWCGTEFERWPSKIKRRNFCSRQCLANYSSKEKNPEAYDSLKDYSAMSENMTRINREMNGDRMTPEVRTKLRESRLGTGEGKGYAKLFGRHEHRVVMERELGRPLRPGEIVHHIDQNKRNNAPNNLMVMTQSEHAALHKRLEAFWAQETDHEV